MNHRVVAVIQARMGSSRLPGKVVRPLGGLPVLGWVVRAAQRATEVDEVVVATSDGAGDDAVAELASQLGVRVVRGSEEDVLDRYLDALEATAADAIVRLTADCPFLDPEIIDHTVSLWRREPSLDHVSTVLTRSLPRGLDVEVISSSALRRTHRTATGADRVHVTSAVYAPGSGARCAGVVFTPDSSHLRLTLDEPADAVALDLVVDAIGAGVPSWRRLVELLEARADIREANGSVIQKDVAQG